VNCPNCGTENLPGSRFCNNCGERLAVACPNCGTANQPGARFCNECGTPLGNGEERASDAGRADGSPASRPSPPPGLAVAPPPLEAPREAERRLVTILFADLVGFTPFAEERDAEEVRETLTRYFEIASEVIVRYGGTVEKFIGDAVMAVWGAPTAHEDDAERAVRAGLELVDAVRVLGEGIQARAGVLTGEAAVTIGATNQGMVAGDLVNTAARLQSVAEPGTVLVGESTQRAAASAVTFEAVGPQSLKGKVAPVAAWRAMRVVAERGGRNRAETLEAPFTGRDIELRLLKDLYHTTGRERRARLVSITGVGGIGKSRLAWEFLKYIDGLVETVWWHHGRSPAYGEGITFWALGEMVRGRAGLAEADDEATTRAKIAATLAEHVPDPEEQRWIEPALLTLLGIEVGAVATEQLFAAWRTFFERIAATATVVMVFEDIQWADPGLLDFIDQLLEWSRAHPIYVVTLARPELLERRALWGAGKRGFAAVHLEPLPESAMREMLEGLVPGLPETTVRAIVARADGVPLYAVETVRMLIADGKLAAHGDGTYRPAGDLASLAVPESLTGLIAARLDGLDPADRALVQDAAVLGRSFTPAALAAVSGSDEATIRPRLDAVVRRELLALAADPRSPERGQYFFVQELIREVAYNTLAKKERKARHLAAARFFESVGSDELAGALAGHYLAAYGNAPAGPEAEALAAQARIALRAAADRAAALGAHDQAVAFLDEALTVTHDAAEVTDLLERAGISATRAGRHERAEQSLRRALELRRDSGDRLAAANGTVLLAEALLNGRRNDEAVALLEPGAAEYADLAPDPVVPALGVKLALAYINADEPGKALETVEQVLPVAEHRDLAEILADALVTKGGALGELGRLREAIGLTTAGEGLAREHGLNELLLKALVVGGYLRSEIDPLGAMTQYRDGFELARRIGHRPRMLLFANNIGYTAFLTGDWDLGLAEMEARLAEELERTDRMLLLGNALIIRASRGEDVASGIAELEEMAKSESEQMMGQLFDTQATAALAAGRLADAAAAFRALAGSQASYGPIAHYQAARPALWARDADAALSDLAAIDASGMHGPVVELRRLTIRAGIAALEGRSAEAESMYRDALRGWHDLGLVWDETLTAIDMATLLDPSLPDVEAAAESARATLERLGARPYLDRLEAALSRAPESVPPAPSRARAAVRQGAAPETA
jgi:class 3 adenylate cyclase/tetratricopeptide (TPR) repeat protein